MTVLKNVVGLFGTCGDSKWRENHSIPLLEKAGIEFFNPVVPDWTDECAVIEAEHAAQDKVVLMVITGETTAIGSMAESGWIALQNHLRGQTTIFVLADMNPEPDPSLRINKIRKLMRAHMAKLPKDFSVVVFNSIVDATNHAISLIKGS